MTSYVTSADGTRIAFNRLGRGAPLIVIGGILCDRLKTGALADALSVHCSVINYDRRGRGNSGDSCSYAVTRDIEDLGALIAAAGGIASVYGHSSGAGLALQAAASGLPIDANRRSPRSSRRSASLPTWSRSGAAIRGCSRWRRRWSTITR